MLTPFVQKKKKNGCLTPENTPFLLKLSGTV